MVHNTDKKDSKKIVPFSVRFDADLFERLDQYIRSFPYSDKRTKYGFIQDCVARELDHIQADSSASVKHQRSNDIHTERTPTQEGERLCFQRLEAILRLKDTTVTEAVADILAAFGRAVDESRRPEIARGDVCDEVPRLAESVSGDLRNARGAIAAADRAIEGDAATQKNGSSNHG